VKPCEVEMKKRKRAVLTTISKKYDRIPICPKCQERLGLFEAKSVGWPEVLVFCSACASEIDEAVKPPKNLHWFVSHLDPLFISSSSDPTILQPSKKPYLEYRSGDSKHVDIDTARQFLNSSHAVLVVAGAGFSCDSGLPYVYAFTHHTQTITHTHTHTHTNRDFRGKKGFYRAGGTEISMEEVNFHEDQDGTDILRTWGYIVSMMSAFRNASPHLGYTYLLNMIKEKDYFVFTSNIDGYFIQSGFDPNRVCECHGNLNILQCSTVGSEKNRDSMISELRNQSLQRLRKRARAMGIQHPGAHKGRKKSWIDAIVKKKAQEFEGKQCDATVWKYNGKLPSLDPSEKLKIRSRSDIPRCKTCGNLARPNVSHVTDEDRHIHREQHERSHKNLKRFLETNRHRKMTIIEIGCGTSIHSLREESELLMKERTNTWTRLIRIDPSDSRVPVSDEENDHKSIPIPMKALDSLALIATVRMSDQ